jgi:tyrosyl-tRNA synthetase
MSSFLHELTWRGLLHQVTDRDGLGERLEQGPIVAYIGFDPTAGSLHVGHLQQLCLLRLLARHGSRPIALVGGGTGMIGDPSGKSEERNLLPPETLLANREAIAGQISRLLEAEDGGEALIADNFEWLGKVALIEFLREVGKLFSVNEMIRKDSVRTRLERQGESLSFTEFSYMLLQAWDFVQLYDRYGCELQLGGSDQWGNISEGVSLIRRMRNGAVAYGVTSPLVTKSDGTKFGKTESGAVWLDPARTSPYEFHQFWLRTPDSDVASYLRRFTVLDEKEIAALEIQVADEPERRLAQRVLADAVTTLVHGEEEAKKAAAAAKALFSASLGDLDASSLAAVVADVPSTPISTADLERGLSVVDLAVACGVVASRGDARRQLAQGAIYLNGQRITEDRPLGASDVLHGRWIVVRRGRSRQHVAELSDGPGLHLTAPVKQP